MSVVVGYACADSGLHLHGLVARMPNLGPTNFKHATIDRSLAGSSQGNPCCVIVFTGLSWDLSMVAAGIPSLLASASCCS